MAHIENGIHQNPGAFGPYPLPAPMPPTYQGHYFPPHYPQTNHHNQRRVGPQRHKRRRQPHGVPEQHWHNHHQSNAWKQGLPTPYWDGSMNGHPGRQVPTHFNPDYASLYGHGWHPYAAPPPPPQYVGHHYTGGVPVLNAAGNYIPHWNPLNIDFNMFALCDINYGVCCKQLFPSKTQFEVHRIQAHKDGGFRCQIHYCGSIFEQKSLLQKHEDESHAGEIKGPISCHVCFTILPHPEENEGYVKYHTFLHNSESS